MSIFKHFATAAAVLTASMTPMAASAEPLSTWFGSYSYQDQTPDGALIAYHLEIGPDGCVVTGRGPGIRESAKCTTTPEGGSAIIKFYNFQGDTARYRNGERLFTLTRTNTGIVTRWQAMPGPDGRISGVYFRPD